MNYLIEQRADDRLAFTLTDRVQDRHSPDPNIKAAWAGILHASNPRLALRERNAHALEDRFYGSAVHRWLVGTGCEAWELDNSLAYDYGPLILRFTEPRAAMLFKLAHGSTGK